MRARIVAAGLCAVALAGCTTGSGARATGSPGSAPTTTAPAAGNQPERWDPVVGATWDLQLSGPVDTGVDAAVYDIDGADNSSAVVAALHAAGRRAVCYVDAGSWEEWRADAGQFPASVRGNPLDGWPGERWLDIRRIDTLKPLMADRFDMCKAKGFDAVDPDNVDGYKNSSGFPLSAADQIAYNTMLAGLAHDRGLAVGLKNDLDQIAELVRSFDFAVNEQCFQYGECRALVPFISAGKPVFHVEYSAQTTAFCPMTTPLELSSIRKKLALDAWRQTC
jgi:hypothetical protein